MIVPVGHRVLIEVAETSERTKGGLFLPQSVRDAERYAGIFGVVAAIGETAWKAFDGGEPWCKVGDTVAFAKYGGMVIKDPPTGKEFRLVNDEDVIAIIHEEET